MLGIDQDRGRRGIGLGPDMTLDHQHHAMDGDAAGTLGHALGAGIGGVGHDGGHQRGRIGRGLAASVMGEAVEEAGPGMDFGEKGGHAHARDNSVEAPAERLCMFALIATDRRDGEPVLGDGGVGDRIRGRGCRQRFQLRIKGCRALGAPGGEAVRHGQSEPPFSPYQFEGRPRQQIILEAAPGSAALDPEVAGAQPVAQMYENGDLPGPGVEPAVALADVAPPLSAWGFGASYAFDANRLGGQPSVLIHTSDGGRADRRSLARQGRAVGRRDQRCCRGAAEAAAGVGKGAV